MDSIEFFYDCDFKGYSSDELIKRNISDYVRAMFSNRIDYLNLKDYEHRLEIELNRLMATNVLYDFFSVTVEKHILTETFDIIDINILVRTTKLSPIINLKYTT